MRMAKRMRLLSLFVAAALILPVLYVLSIGPILFYDDRIGLSPEVEGVLETAYGPLITLSESESMGGKAFRRYLRLWARERIHEPNGIITTQ